MKKPYITHIALSGGAMKGLCYMGVFRYLYIENLVNNLKFIHGTSIGSFFAIALALKIPIEYLEEEVKKVIKTINEDDDMAITQKKIHNIILSNGIFDLRFMMSPIIKFLEKEHDIKDITFQELAKKTGVNIYIQSVNFNTGEPRTFSTENSPNISVIDASLASMSIPFLVNPTKIEGDYYIDGEFAHSTKIDMFKDAHADNILHIFLCECREFVLEELEKNTELNFMKYSTRICHILLKRIFYMYKATTHERCTEDYVLKISDFHCKNPIKFNIKNANEIRMETSDEDIENFILRGFIDITNYMNKRYKDNTIDIM
jgi:predicted acylesterase/phospholipase RssA